MARGADASDLSESSPHSAFHHFLFKVLDNARDQLGKAAGYDYVTNSQDVHSAGDYRRGGSGSFGEPTCQSFLGNMFDHGRPGMRRLWCRQRKALDQAPR